MYIDHIYLKSFGCLKSLAKISIWVLLIHLWSYQVLLESYTNEKCLLRVYSCSPTTFIFTVMVISASRSFLTRTDAHTDTRTPGKPVYRGGTGPPKKLSCCWGCGVLLYKTWVDVVVGVCN